MNENVAEFRFIARGRPRLAEADKTLALVMNHEPAVELPLGVGARPKIARSSLPPAAIRVLGRSSRSSIIVVLPVASYARGYSVRVENFYLLPLAVGAGLVDSCSGVASRRSEKYASNASRHAIFGIASRASGLPDAHHASTSASVIV